MGYFDIANNRLLYLLVGLGLACIIGLAVIFAWKAWKQARELGISNKTLVRVAQSSAIFTVIPSISVIIGLFSLSAVLGVPWSWFRLSVAGAVSYELTAAEMVSDAVGFASAGDMALGGNYKLFGAVMLVTSICILPGIITNIFAAKKLQTGMIAYRKKKGDWGIIFNFAFAAALVVAMIPYVILNGVTAITVFVCSSLVSAVLYYIEKKRHVSWLGSFVMSVSIVVSMAISVVMTNLLA